MTQTGPVQSIQNPAPPAYSITDPAPALRRKLTKSSKNPYLSYVNKPKSKPRKSTAITGPQAIKGPAVLVIDVGDEAIVEITKSSSTFARLMGFGPRWMRTGRRDVGAFDALAVAGMAVNRAGVC